MYSGYTLRGAPYIHSHTHSWMTHHWCSSYWPRQTCLSSHRRSHSDQGPTRTRMDTCPRCCVLVALSWHVGQWLVLGISIHPHHGSSVCKVVYRIWSHTPSHCRCPRPQRGYGGGGSGLGNTNNTSVICRLINVGKNGWNKSTTAIKVSTWQLGKNVLEP